MKSHQLVWNSYISGFLLERLSNDVPYYDVLPLRCFEINYDCGY